MMLAEGLRLFSETSLMLGLLCALGLLCVRTDKEAEGLRGGKTVLAVGVYRRHPLWRWMHGW